MIVLRPVVFAQGFRLLRQVGKPAGARPGAFLKNPACLDRMARSRNLIPVRF